MTEQTLMSHLVIVGGGTAGWMSAAAIQTLMAATGLKVTLIESDDIPTVGVGEATIPQITLFTELLGIDEDEFVRRTQATFKLGIEFRDWGRKGDSYFHPFGQYGVDMAGIRFHHFWLRAKALGLTTPLSDYCLQTVAAKQGRFMRPAKGTNSPLSTIQYAFHFDAGLFAAYLRERGEAAGVIRREGRVEQVDQDSETGNITGVRLASGEQIDGDFFIDCTGFRALLLGQALGGDYTDWSRWLPVNRAMATACVSPEPPRPYTQAIAEGAGWRWRIPLQNRLGNGYVYSDQFLEDDKAEARLRAALEGEAIGPFRRLKFTTGHRRNVWIKNCLSLGLSAGFLEPLESTSIHLVQSGLSRFIATFPAHAIDPVERDLFNVQTRVEYEQIRDFLILHYKATARQDTPFWDYVRSMDVPDTLSEKIEVFRAHGRLHRNGLELFNESSWLSVMVGQNIEPHGHHPLAQSIPKDELLKRLAGIEQTIIAAADHMPNHADFIAAHCQASD